MLKKLKNSKKGFTLAELLIVVAIIGVLVAISIPIFTAQLEKAREATDEANIRSLYAECSAAVLTGSSDDTKITVNKDASGEVTDATATYTMTQKVNGLSNGTSVTIGGVEIKSADFNTGTATITVKATGDASIKIQ
ncbi:type IV pilin protein [Bilifractor sp. HCP3S3_D3]|uniref:type IV pilin protein n=1 Tax=Bilifractor sp. HCP3S3_D3 TaxID=3438907 RepID=UPI003F8CB06C